MSNIKTSDEDTALDGCNLLLSVLNIYLQQIYQEHKSNDLYKYPNFSVFDFIEPDEMRLSYIIAWLLDPRGSHGQGSGPLKIFLETLGFFSNCENVERAEVKVELPNAYGRTDIEIKLVDLVVVIENKFRAGDQHRQLDRYFDYLSTVHTQKVMLVYLSDGKIPSDHSINAENYNKRTTSGDLVIWSFSGQFIAWLKCCCIECKSERVCTFIREFVHYIELMFVGTRNPTMTDRLVDRIVEDEESIVSAMHVVFAADLLRVRLLNTLKTQIYSKLSTQKIEIFASAYERYSGLHIEFSDNSPYKFGFEFQNTQYNGLIYGVLRQSKNETVHKNELDLLIKNFGAASQSEHWLWYRAASKTDALISTIRDWNGSIEPWREIANGALASKIVNAYDQFNQVLRIGGESR